MTIASVLGGSCPFQMGKSVEPDKSAVLFKEKGTVELSGRSYYILMDISLETLLKGMDPVGMAIKTVSKQITNSFKVISANIPRRA